MHLICIYLKHIEELLKALKKREKKREIEREREGECERDKMRYNCSIRLYTSTSVIKRKTLRSVLFILLIIFLKSMLNPTIIVICLFM